MSCNEIVHDCTTDNRMLTNTPGYTQYREEGIPDDKRSDAVGACMAQLRKERSCNTEGGKRRRRRKSRRSRKSKRKSRRKKRKSKKRKTRRRRRRRK